MYKLKQTEIRISLHIPFLLLLLYLTSYIGIPKEKSPEKSPEKEPVLEEEAPVEPEPVVEEEKPKEKSPEKKEPEATGSLEFVEVFEETVSIYFLLGISSVELSKIRMYSLPATYHWDCSVPFNSLMKLE